MDCDIESVGAMLGLEYAEPDADVAELMRVSAVKEVATTEQPKEIALIDLADGHIVATFAPIASKPMEFWNWKDMYDMERDMCVLTFDILQGECRRLKEEVTRLRAQVAQPA